VMGEAWVANWSNLDHLTLVGVLAVALLTFVLYVLLAAALIYALPLTFLRDEPLVPSLRQSLKASRHFTAALLVLLGVLLMPLLLGAIAASLSLWASYLLWIMIGSVTLPVVSASLYCSYRDIFSARDNWMPADRRRPAGGAGPAENSLRSL
jgi:membrane-anchored glycerophosphoryl diester phosphodiesterase (GDPDase)